MAVTRHCRICKEEKELATEFGKFKRPGHYDTRCLVCHPYSKRWPFTPNDTIKKWIPKW